MTLLVTSVFGDTLAELDARSQAAWSAGAQAVELRIDTLETDPLELASYLKAPSDYTWIVTCRSAEEGGNFRGECRDRVSRLIAAARDTGAYVDFELADWRRSANIRQKIRLAATTPDGGAVRLILSSHDFAGPPADLTDRVKETLDAGDGVIAKIAYKGRGALDSFEALDLLHKHGSTTIAVCMNEDGLWTRVLAKKLGAFATYSTLTLDSATAPGQITLDEMVNLYRWHSIDRATRVFGVIGDPVAHSLSPLLFNKWFADAGFNAVYLPLRVRADGNALSRFLDECRKRPWLDVGGFSVTIPHKEAALRYVGGATTPEDGSIGAINTLCFEQSGIAGHNTDRYAAINSLVCALGCAKRGLVGVSVDVLGAGGSARAVLKGLHEYGCRVTIFSRSTEKTRRLADEFGFAAGEWNDRANRSGEVLVNCTPVGMWPDVDASPMPPDSLDGCRLVFDLIYRPLETKLLAEATATGCKTLNGLDMFIRQAAVQFELWTSKLPDLDIARDLLERKLSTSV